ncbi:hypothetical protein SOHN41_02407 [Shewanella sp. HN-41]|nr:hypothetical protein SOHN41_02407 [Shewanella sp. HN-41]
MFAASSLYRVLQTEMSSDEPLEPDPANTGVGMGQSTAHF